MLVEVVYIRVLLPLRTVVGGILLSGDHLLGVEELPVGTSAHLIDDIGLQVDVDGAGHVLALTCTTVRTR